MLKRALLCIALVACTTIFALTAKAPADVGPNLQPAILSSAPDLRKTQIIDCTFGFVEGESEAALSASTHGLQSLLTFRI